MKLVGFATFFWCAVVASGAATSGAQSLTTASKGAELSAYGGYTVGSLDYASGGQGSFAKKGVSAGAEFTLFPRFILKPSMEVRANLLAGNDATEKSVLFGPRVQMDVRQRLHPYADLLIGGGEILYHPVTVAGYTGDRSKVYSYGGGLDVDLPRHFAVRFDFQQQRWNLGAPTGAPADILMPRLLMVGVKYTVPFRSIKRAGDYR